MAISEEQRRAICRIYVPGVGRGTGFLVAPGVVMTAAHVVWTAKYATTPVLGDIELTFYVDDDKMESVKGRVAPADFHYSDREDWALVAIAAADIAKVTAQPLKVRTLALGYRLSWESFGFHELVSIGGARLGGSIVAQVPRAQLTVDPPLGDPAGVSGAPCLVQGTAQGLVIQAIGTSTLYAMCMSTLGRRVKFVESEPPYVLAAAAQLDGVPKSALVSLAKTLGFTAFETEVADPDRPRELARELMRRGGKFQVRDAFDALLDLVDANVLNLTALEQIVELAGKSWIAADAARSLASTLGQTRAAIVNTHSPTIADWYLHRAGTLDGGIGRGKFRCVRVDIDVPTKDVVQARILAALEKAFPGNTVATLMAKHNHAARPIVLVLATPLPRQMIDEVKQALQIVPVHVVILPGGEPGDALRAEYADSLVAPDLDPASTSAALAAWDLVEYDLQEQKSQARESA